MARIRWAAITRPSSTTYASTVQPAPGFGVEWLVTDQLGTPRMIVDQTGSLASVKRHDYLPFGEEIGGPQVALLGGRTTTQGYSGDSTRQHFTGYEADAETGLNFAEARYQSSAQGRFTSVDPFGASASVGDPQSFNRYSYVNNNPTNLTDPSGMMTPNPATGIVQTDDESYARTLQGASDSVFQQDVNKDAGARMYGAGTVSYVGNRAVFSADTNLPIESLVGSNVTASAEVGEPQNSEGGDDLARRAASGLSNNPGLLEEIQANAAPGVDVHIVACQAAKESNFAQITQTNIPHIKAEYSSGATGAAGEVGLLQVKPSTVGLSANALKSVGTNVKAATGYLMKLQNHFGTDMRTTLAVYNWGPTKFNNVGRDGNKIYSGSLSYADKILDCSRRLILPSDSRYKLFH